MTAREVAERLGGRVVLRRSVNSDFDLAEAIEEGLPIATVQSVVDRGTFSARELHELVLPQRTLEHRKQHGEPLTARESDRLTRAVRVAVRAEEAFGSQEKPARWLRSPSRGLRDKRPIDLLVSDTGARVVEQALGRIEHGIVG